MFVFDINVEYTIPIFMPIPTPGNPEIGIGIANKNTDNFRTEI